MTLDKRAIVAFAATTDAVRTRKFYEEALGLRFVEDDGFALVFDAHGTSLRISKLKELKPHAFTVLGWEVPDIHQDVAALAKRGVAFERYGFPGQDESGVWTSPNGAKVAWFKDPDGNVLSLSQHK